MTTYNITVIPICEWCELCLRQGKLTKLKFLDDTNCGERNDIWSTYQIEAETEEEAISAAAMHFTMDKPDWIGLMLKDTGHPLSLLLLDKHDWPWGSRVFKPSASP